MTYSFGLLGTIAALLAYCVTPVLCKWFVRRGWVDRPDGERKIHIAPVPRAGGAILAVACVGSYVCFSALRRTSFASVHLDFTFLLTVFPGAALVFLVGLWDDAKRLPPFVKLSAQLVACILVFIGGVRVSMVHLFDTGDWRFSLPATLLWLLLCTNAFNLIDGMDGLSGGLGLFALLALICNGSLNHNVPLLLATVPLAGALAGFLPSNFNPASVFLGDSGSYLIGFLIGCFSTVWSEKSATALGIAAPLMALAVPIADVVLVVARRFLRRKPIFGADRLHLHHRLLERGLTPRRVVLVLYASAVVGAGLALLSSIVDRSRAELAFLIFLGLVGFGIAKLRYLEFRMAGRIAFRGGFRRAVCSEMILDAAGPRLMAAETPAALWSVVRAAASELGFCHVRMTLDGVQFFDSFSGASGLPSWTITVPLQNRGYIEFAHVFEQQVAALAAVPFAAMLGHCLGPRCGTQELTFAAATTKPGEFRTKNAVASVAATVCFAALMLFSISGAGASAAQSQGNNSSKDAKSTVTQPDPPPRRPPRPPPPPPPPSPRKPPPPSRHRDDDGRDH